MLEPLFESAGDACWSRGFGFGVASAVVLSLVALLVARVARRIGRAKAALPTRAERAKNLLSENRRRTPAPGRLRTASAPPEIEPAPRAPEESSEAALVTAAIDVATEPTTQKKKKRANKRCEDSQNLIEFV